MDEYREEETVFITSQYEEKPSPVMDEDAIKSFPVTSSNRKKFEIISKGDDAPFLFIQSINFGEKYPCQGMPSGAIFSKHWADSYVNKSNQVLIPGSAFGHTADEAAWKMQRVENHLYVIAGQVKNNDTMLLLHYLSRDMDQNQYNKLVKEIKAGLISTSIYERTKYRIDIDEKKGTETLTAVESLGRQRNDLVEWDATGMPSKVVATSQKAAAKNNSGEGEVVMAQTYKELVAALKAVIEENRTDHMGVVSDLGLEIPIMTSEKATDLETFEKIKGKVEDPLAFFESAISAQGEAFKTLRNAAIETEFGKSPDLKKMAEDMFSIRIGGQKEISAEIERIKGLESIKSAAAKSADGRSESLVSGAHAKEDFWGSKETVIGGKNNG